MYVRTLALAACCTLLTAAGLSQAPNQMNGSTIDKPSSQSLASPAETAKASLHGKQIKISYNSPRAKGRKIMGGVVPYGKVWRTGANPATTMVTETNLKIGTLDVPAGTYTIYTLPSAGEWMLIVNKQTGQWGTEYNQNQDLGRTAMTGKALSTPQDNMSIGFEHTSGASTELHVKWENTDEYVTVKAQ